MVKAQEKISGEFDVIGLVHSPFKEKFGIPRQPGLVPAATAILEMRPPYDDPMMFEGLEGFSHIWLSFLFHACITEGWRKRVRPPRLGGNQSIGVFASRSPYRPNHLGLSLVKLDRIDVTDGVRLHLRGVDLLDGTPVVDIKPYLPYAESVPDARAGFASETPAAGLRVVFNSVADSALNKVDDSGQLRQLITAVLELDPRPAYRRKAEPDRAYGIRLQDVDVRWRVLEDRLEVTEVLVIQ